MTLFHSRCAFYQSDVAIRMLVGFAIICFAGCGQFESNGNTARLEKIIATGLQSGASQYEVVDNYESYLADYPKDDLGWTLFGHVHKELDQNDAAVECYQTALKLNPGRVEALTGLGVLSRHEGKNDEALEFYRRALKIDPNFAQAYASMSVIAIARNDYKEAVVFGERAYGLDKEDPTIPANLAVAYHYVGDNDKRDEFYRIAAILGYTNLPVLDQIFSGEMTVSE